MSSRASHSHESVPHSDQNTASQLTGELSEKKKDGPEVREAPRGKEDWTWNSEAMSRILDHTQDYNVVIPTLREQLDNGYIRNPEVVTWMNTKALDGHVPLAVHAVRNLAKWRCGPVPTRNDVLFSFEMFMMVLIRTLQDTAAVREHFAQRVDGNVYRFLRDKCFGWLEGGTDPSFWPRVSEVVSGMRLFQSLHKRQLGSLPPPFWVGKCTQSITALLGGGHVHFDKPDWLAMNAWTGDAASAREQANKTRFDVWTKFIGRCEKCSTWHELVNIEPEEVINLVTLADAGSSRSTEV